MKWKTPEPREYYSKYEKIDVRNGKGWYECYRLPGEVIAICEPQHLQEVNCFLIFGEDKALMLDTGMGICDIQPLVRELCGEYYDTLQIVNCHAHFDHTGCNHRFAKVFGSDTELTRRQAECGVPHEPLASQTDAYMFLFDYPEGFAPEEYCIRPYGFEPCEDGHIFDLGGRNVEFITTPGHTEDHAMLYDHRDGILFAGDMIYFGAIYVQFENDVLGHSNIQDYIESLEKVKERCAGLRSIYVSHNDFITDPSAIDLIEDAMKAVRDGKAAGEPLQDENFGYYMDPPTVTQYLFDGFSIIAGK
ncbi:MAG: MBL fold metallo-hydrolase [Bacillota bacterium]|nr:MBL fold metallo-hydrolase [Bacillota bacterium]